jgi:putative tricarboxylic transport membrane protein
MLEENFRRAMVLSDGDWSIFLRRPISLGFLLLAAALLLAVTLPNIRRSREAAFRE